jgi:hypothetical protein
MAEPKSPPRRFLFVWWEGGGNMPPALELVRQLVARGHGVHALSDACSEAEFVAAGASFAAYRRAPSRLDHSPEADTLKDWEARGPAQTIAILRDRLMCGPALAYAQDTLDEIERFHPDALVVMDATFGGMIAGQSAGVPVAAVAPQILVYPVPGRPAFGPGLLPARNILERLRDRLLLSVVNSWMNKGLPQLNAARAAIGLPPAPTVFETLRADRLLVLTTPALELPGGPLPDNVRYTGPILVDPEWARPWTSPWDEGDERPLVAGRLRQHLPGPVGRPPQHHRGPRPVARARAGHHRTGAQGRRLRGVPQRGRVRIRPAQRGPAAGGDYGDPCRPRLGDPRAGARRSPGLPADGPRPERHRRPHRLPRRRPSPVAEGDGPGHRDRRPPRPRRARVQARRGAAGSGGAAGRRPRRDPRRA